ncbi:MAG: CPBP family intramembrane metalloprotease [Clostridia bacterium]|nr:CPBP family intramembrane metalloprotease [Clostridia bacterium]
MEVDMKKTTLSENKSKIYVIGTVLFSTTAMCLVDGVWSPPYLYKSLVKIALFLAIPFAYFLIFREKKAYLRQLFRPQKRHLTVSALLGLGVFSVIMLAYVLLGRYIDLSAIQNSLTSGAGVTAENFVYVAVYISFVNSLLEEFFFRGYAFLILKKEGGRLFAYLFSSIAFAVYHVGMTGGWFHLPIYLLSMLGLAAGGCIFNYLNERFESIYPSWLVHMCANFAINTIGFILFGIL